jgi:hypothetical protein
MTFDQRKMSIGKLAFWVLVFGMTTVYFVPLATAQTVSPGSEWRQDKGPDKRERHRLRREARQELSVVRELDREHQVRFRMNNQMKAVGYYDNFGEFHYYGYYDASGFFHRY